MSYNNTDNRQSGKSSFGRRDFGGPKVPRQMHKAICSECKKDCEVPFFPSGSKPVYCSICFDKQRGRFPTPRFEDRGFKKPYFDDKANKPSLTSDQFNALNTKLDKILSMLTSKSIVKEVLVTKPEVVEVVKKKKKTSKKEVASPIKK